MGGLQDGGHCRWLRAELVVHACPDSTIPCGSTCAKAVCLPFVGVGALWTNPSHWAVEQCSVALTEMMNSVVNEGVRPMSRFQGAISLAGYLPSSFHATCAFPSSRADCPLQILIGEDTRFSCCYGAGTRHKIQSFGFNINSCALWWEHEQDAGEPHDSST